MAVAAADTAARQDALEMAASAVAEAEAQEAAHYAAEAAEQAANWAAEMAEFSSAVVKPAPSPPSPHHHHHHPHESLKIALSSCCRFWRTRAGLSQAHGEIIVDRRSVFQAHLTVCTWSAYTQTHSTTVFRA